MSGNRTAMAPLLVFAWVAAVLAVLAPDPAGAEDKKGEIHLVLATAYGKPITMNKVFRWLVAPRIEAYSRGRITTELHQGGTLCHEHKCIEKVRLGELDVGAAASGNMGAFGAVFDANLLPFLFRTDSFAQESLNGWYGAHLRQRARDEMGLHLLASVISSGFHSLANSVRQVRVPEDIAEVKLRVTRSPIELAMVKTWGATPIKYDWGHLHEGLRAGTVEGMYIPNLYTWVRGLQDYTPHITNTRGTLATINVSMAAKRYDALPEWARAVVDRVFDEVGRESLAIDRLSRAQAAEGLAEKVAIYTPTDEEYEKWAATAPAAWLTMKGRYEPEIVRRLLDEQGQTTLIELLEDADAL